MIVVSFLDALSNRSYWYACDSPISWTFDLQSTTTCTSLLDLGADISPCLRINLSSPYSHHRLWNDHFFGTATMGAAQALCGTFEIMPSFFAQPFPITSFMAKGSSLGLWKFKTTSGFKWSILGSCFQFILKEYCMFLQQASNSGVSWN